MSTPALLVVMSLCLLGAGCIATVPHADPAVLAAARPLYPDYSAELLEEDRDVFVDSCTGCHLLTPGKKLTVAEWPPIIDEMRKEVAYDKATGERILRYLQTSRLYWEAEKERIKAEREARKRERSGSVNGARRSAAP